MPRNVQIRKSFIQNKVQLRLGSCTDEHFRQHLLDLPPCKGGKWGFSSGFPTLTYVKPLVVTIAGILGELADPKYLQLKDMGVSENSGTPKSSILIGFSIINPPFWGPPIFGNSHINARFLFSARCIAVTILSGQGVPNLPRWTFYEWARVGRSNINDPKQRWNTEVKNCKAIRSGGKAINSQVMVSFIF